MRRAYKIAKLYVVAIFLTVATLPALAYERATIAQLEQMLAAAHGKSDKALAKRLGELELTERLSTLRLEKLQASLPGDKSRQALLVLSDNSVFHDLPAAEIPHLAAPDSDTQSKILSKTTDYIRQALPRQIDIVVSRNTARFDNLKVVSSDHTLPAETQQAKTMTEAEQGAQFFPAVALAVVEDRPFRLTGKTSETVTYRNGAEVVVYRDGAKVTDAPANAPKRPPPSGISNWGVFGPLLEVVVNDISAAKTDWGHWEQGRKGTLAVFRYDVPQDQSNYDVQSCCFTGGVGWNVYETLTAYHGEIAVDPETGAILRLTIQTDILADQPIYRADILAEYGPVELGGKEYIFPTRSVTISGAPVPVMVQEQNCADFHCTPSEYVHPKDTVVSDTVYNSYHVFRAETRILPTDASAPAGDSPSSSQPQNRAPRKQEP
jgi:hypothetical protein